MSAAASTPAVAIRGQVTADYPTARLQDRAEYKQAQSAELDKELVLLALAIVIALLGIANTLALSVFERTRELGLLRAIGMARCQMRAMVRWESVIIALFGTCLGLVIGLFFSWAMVTAVPNPPTTRPLGPAERVGRRPGVGRGGTGRSFLIEGEAGRTAQPVGFRQPQRSWSGGRLERFAGAG